MLLKPELISLVSVVFSKTSMLFECNKIFLKVTYFSLSLIKSSTVCKLEKLTWRSYSKETVRKLKNIEFWRLLIHGEIKRCPLRCDLERAVREIRSTRDLDLWTGSNRLGSGRTSIITNAVCNTSAFTMQLLILHVLATNYVNNLF